MHKYFQVTPFLSSVKIHFSHTSYAPWLVHLSPPDGSPCVLLLLLQAGIPFDSPPPFSRSLISRGKQQLTTDTIGKKKETSRTPRPSVICLKIVISITVCPYKLINIRENKKEKLSIKNNFINTVFTHFILVLQIKSVSPGVARPHCHCSAPPLRVAPHYLGTTALMYEVRK